MQVAALPTEESQKVPLPFSGSLSGSVVCAKGLGNGREVGEGGEKEKVRWRRNRALRARVVEKFAFYPFHETSMSFHSSPYESIRITFDLGPLHRHRRRRHPSFSLPFATPQIAALEIPAKPPVAK